GGGNTFHLVYEMHRHGLMQAIRERVQNGLPYMGWSAGSNVACPGLFTTNDMPIIQPASFETLKLVPFQINPHYLDAHPQGHGGETREDRIKEFMVVQPDTYIVGLREATMLRVKGRTLSLIGERPMRVFRHGLETKEYQAGQDLSFLMA
ncbi:MAG: dipeptidase PepE, partial [Bacteroidales bacterium]|nr:dipeptidase PepE [Bacteroidales bacterium]